MKRDINLHEKCRAQKMLGFGLYEMFLYIINNDKTFCKVLFFRLSRRHEVAEKFLYLVIRGHQRSIKSETPAGGNF
jgi:hypothetical protein